MPDHLERRIIDLEIRLTHQQIMLEEVSDVIARQAETIDNLTHKLRRLQERVAEMAAGWQASHQDDKPPPHY